MKIFQIQPTVTQIESKQVNYKAGNITKKSLNAIKENPKEAIIATTAGLLSGLEALELLKNNGITYCEAKDNTVNVASGYNKGFYSLKFSFELPPETLKSYFAQFLSDRHPSLGGLVNYKSMVEDLKRQDIIQKGLKIHTYELRTDVPQKDAEAAASYLSKFSKKYIKPKDLFFIEDDAFYYDKLEKTAYAVNIEVVTPQRLRSTIRTCKFNTNENNNAIGFTQSSRDIFTVMVKTETYNEQMTPSCELPLIAEPANNKLYAEAFRFGNTKTYNYRTKLNIPNVLDNIAKKIGTRPDENRLQFVKAYDKTGHIISRICFYDSTIGRSLIYDGEGKYLYQMEYNKDESGNIIACSKY